MPSRSRSPSPDALAESFRFAAGQHLTLRADIGGQDVRRSYSICSGVQDGILRIAVKRNPGGVFSGWANETLKAGDTLDVMPPLGHFGVAARPRQPQELRGLRRRQRHHAAALDREDDAGRGAALPLHAVLRQSRVGHGDVQGGACRAEGHLPDAVQPGPRALARGAGHRPPARPDRPDQGRCAGCALARSRCRRRRVRLRTGRHDAGGRGGAEGAGLPGRENQDRALRDERPQARAQAGEAAGAGAHRVRGDGRAGGRHPYVHAGEGQGEHSRGRVSRPASRSPTRARAASARPAGPS